MNRLKNTLIVTTAALAAAIGLNVAPALAHCGHCGTDRGDDASQAGMMEKHAEHMGEHMIGDHIQVVGMHMQRPEIVEVNTGEKMKMSDGDVHDYYETHKTGEGIALVTLELKMVTMPGMESADLDPGSVMLVDPKIKGKKGSFKPFARFVEKDWVAVGPEMIPVNGKAAVQFAFEVPEKQLDSLVLNLDAKAVAPVSELLEP